MEQLAQLLLLLLAVAFVINLIPGTKRRGGADGARDWLRSKFLGRSAEAYS